jgi:hypothetical protein
VKPTQPLEAQEVRAERVTVQHYALSDEVGITSDGNKKYIFIFSRQMQEWRKLTQR